jgi:glycosyltransferase involved in cell wall biosynthesis
VLFVGRGRLTVPLAPWLAKKWDALESVFELRVLNAGSGSGDPRFHLLPEGAASFYPRLPAEVARELRSFRPQAVVASDPYVAAAVLTARRLVRSHAKVIVEVHGDPKTFTRLYGSPARKWLSLGADAVSSRSIRAADATRALSAFTSSLVEKERGIPATACFPTYSDLSAFADPPLQPLPQARTVAFVGALEPYKNVRGLAAAWRQVAREVPEARLTIVGLLRELPEQVEQHRELLPVEVAATLDASRALVLPSWPEGLGRVVLEAFARGRTVVATDAGGIPDIVTNDVDGLLIGPGATGELAAGLRRVLEDDALVARLGAAAHLTYGRWHQTAADFADAYRELVDRALAGAR